MMKSKVYEEGLEYDRRWMLVDNEGRFLTQREHPTMALFSCAFTGEGIEVSKGEEKISLGLEENAVGDERVQVWSSKLKAQEVSEIHTEWFSDLLGINARLVRMTDISRRTKRIFTPPYKTKVSFADGYPILILGQASMNELNEKLEEEIKPDRFRANIIIDTKTPHEEDKWKDDFFIGHVKMKVIKPCARCVVTTIDQLTAEKGKEPLKTLSTYRQWRNKIWFGANTISLEKGIIEVGDEVKLS